MTGEELKKKFTETNTRQVDFIAWAKSKGVEIRSSDVSRHATTDSISRWAEIAYIAFFDSVKNPTVNSTDIVKSLIEAIKNINK